MAQRDVEAADAAANGRGQRAFDADQIFAEGLDGFVGQPVAGLVEGALSGQNFHPLNFLGAAIGFFDGGIEDADGRGPNIGAGAVALHEGDGRIVGDLEQFGLFGDFCHGQRVLPNRHDVVAALRLAGAPKSAAPRQKEQGRRQGNQRRENDLQRRQMVRGGVGAVQIVEQ